MRTRSILKVALLVIGLQLAVSGCSSAASSPLASARGSPTPSATASASPTSELVGQWKLDRTCTAIVDALTEADLVDVIPMVLSELLYGPDPNTLPADFDSKHPCANARPPTEHSHTFWADATFNSWDENGNQVDDGTYTLVDDHTFTMGDPPITFTFDLVGDGIMFDVVVPPDCSTKKCHASVAWPFSVAYPGEMWTRVTTGPHVP